ncbi:hypothetical protein FB567DRAFT_530545 [Paraphoma chrysanthemicola]|uniref:EthD domain-containing protein n=1 Tax=Paraphoma chrysanthemicola TaxID=798071 RepID=A0A8K0R348_9PLEO|nr:hypothetical protein FB567DRAFT_530545 [Paraphoma chrysanthemicola]
MPLLTPDLKTQFGSSQASSTMSPPTQMIKQIAAGRRKPNMTRKEYFDHRFRIHGSISDGTSDKNYKPHKYIQTQVFDAAFGPRPDGPLNANQYWVGRDDTTELYFRDWEHVISCFSSEHIKTKVGPDGPLFADFETAISLMASEEVVELHTRLSAERQAEALGQGSATVAMYFLATPNGERNGRALADEVSPLLARALERYCQNEVSGLVANVGEVSEKFDLQAYFGGANVPQYALVYKIYLKDASSVMAVRRSQKVFEAEVGGRIDLHDSFILFSQEALVLDVGHDIAVSLSLLYIAGKMSDVRRSSR